MGASANVHSVEWIRSLTFRQPALAYPVLPAPPTAVLVPWFKSRGVVRVFERGWDATAADYRPAAIAATWPQVETLLLQKVGSLTHAVVVLTRSVDGLLTVEQREQIWRAFRVPVFEQIIGENGILLAAECEAHAGLHIESPKLELLGRATETEACGCGRSTPRIKPVAQLEDVRSAAAYAR